MLYVICDMCIKPSFTMLHLRIKPSLSTYRILYNRILYNLPKTRSLNTDILILCIKPILIFYVIVLNPYYSSLYTHTHIPIYSLMIFWSWIGGTVLHYRWVGVDYTLYSILHTHTTPYSYPLFHTLTHTHTHTHTAGWFWPVGQYHIGGRAGSQGWPGMCVCVCVCMCVC
jgi:hypothetical protein